MGSRAYRAYRVLPRFAGVHISWVLGPMGHTGFCPGLLECIYHGFCLLSGCQGRPAGAGALFAEWLSGPTSRGRTLGMEKCYKMLIIILLICQDI
jgi:hypothetical protein